MPARFSFSLGVIFGASLIGISVSLNTSPNAPAYHNVQFGSVCQHEGGQVKGDICIKDGSVILTKKSVIAENDR